MSRWDEQKKLVLATAQLMLEKGLVVGTSGNVSFRLPAGEGQDLLAITPSSRYYDSLTVEDIQVVDFEAEPVEGDLPPSVETMLHIGIYTARKNVNAVIHSHPVYASAISLTGEGIPPILEDQVVFLGGEIDLAKDAPSGSDELVDAVLQALGAKNAVILPNHGAVSVGRTMREAFTAAELLEKTAKVYYLASSMGKVNLMPDETVQAGKAFFNMLQSQ